MSVMPLATWDIELKARQNLLYRWSGNWISGTTQKTGPDWTHCFLVKDSAVHRTRPIPWRVAAGPGGSVLDITPYILRPGAGRGRIFDTRYQVNDRCSGTRCQYCRRPKIDCHHIPTRHDIESIQYWWKVYLHCNYGSAGSNGAWLYHQAGSAKWRLILIPIMDFNGWSILHLNAFQKSVFAKPKGKPIAGCMMPRQWK